MKRYWIWGLLALAVLALRLPGQAWDASELEPAETVLVGRHDRYIRIETDTGAWGEGQDLAAAAEDLNRRTAGRIFLETADYLLLEGSPWDPETLRELFRPGCWVCMAEGVEDLEEAGRFLRIHRPDATLLRLSGERVRLKTLTAEKGGLLLEE